MADIDPTQKFRQWSGAFFLAALAALDVPAIGWEIFVRHATDPGVLSAVFTLAAIVIAGPVGIRIVRDRNGKD